MQTQQQHKPAPKPERKLSVGELVVALLNVCMGTFSACAALTTPLISVQVSITGITLGLAALGEGMVAFFLIFFKLRLALWGQLLAALSLLGLTGFRLWYAYDQQFDRESSLIFVGSPFISLLLLVLCAWFLKRMDD